MENFVTNDTYYAAALLACGKELCDCTINNNIHSFHFINKEIPKLEEIQSDVNLLVSFIRVLKSYVYGDFCYNYTNPKTTDLFFAAFLMSNDIKIKNVSKQNGKSFFHFSPFQSEEEIKRLRISYIKGHLINSGKFVSCIKKLKQTINGATT